jgi:DNA-binding beta-propeller fold protein YncE
VLAPKEGSLVWTTGLDDKIHYLTSGRQVSSIPTTEKTRIRQLFQNGPESVYFFGDKTFGTISLPEQSGRGLSQGISMDNRATFNAEAGPESVLATPDGEVIGFTQEYFFRMPKDLSMVRAWPRDPTVPVPTTLLWEPSQKQIYGLSPGFDEVMVFNAETGICVASFNLGQGASPSALALAPDGQVWVTYGGLAMVEVINPAREGESKSYPPERPEMPTQGFTSIAPGPDGAMWLTSDQAPWFTRVTLDGVFSPFAPDSPMVPCALAPGHEGRLLFGIQGTDTLAQRLPCPEP